MFSTIDSSLGTLSEATSFDAGEVLGFIFALGLFATVLTGAVGSAGSQQLNAADPSRNSVLLSQASSSRLSVKSR